MSDTNKAPPPWLTATDDTRPVYHGEQIYRLSRATQDVVGEAGETPMEPEALPLPEWLAWRSRVAEALGFDEVDPAHVCTEFMRDFEAMKNAAIAAELRRMADELRPGHELVFRDGMIDCPAGDVSDWLRRRADELEGKSP